VPNNSFDIWLNSFCDVNHIEQSECRKHRFLSFSEYSEFQYKENIFTVFEDWWIRHPEIIKSKISALYSKSKTIFARKCFVKKITKPEADIFLNENHIYGTSTSKVRIGLFFENELVAAMTFAAMRKFHTGNSAEILRYCSKNYTTITGGLSKLLKFYMQLYAPQSIMTYTDWDWGRGDAFGKLGFCQTEKKTAVTFFCNTVTGERIPKKYFNDIDNVSQYEQLTNSGSLKFVMMV